ncbi:GrpB family protein [Streptomyces sp. NPDC001667]
MPFPDQSTLVAVLGYQPQWAVDIERLARTLRGALGDQARAIDHVGSTAVPGLAVKDCVDIQVLVDDIDEDRQVTLLAAIGFRCRPAPWKRAELSCRSVTATGPPVTRPLLPGQARLRSRPTHG